MIILEQFAIDETMVLGILTSVAACPAIIGTTEAVRQGQRNNAKERHRGRKSNLTVSTSSKSSQAQQVNGLKVVLRNNKVRPLASISGLRQAIKFANMQVTAVHRLTIRRRPRV